MNTVGDNSFDWQSIQLVIAGIVTGLGVILLVVRIGKNYANATSEEGMEKRSKAYGQIIVDAAMMITAVWIGVWALGRIVNFFVGGVQNVL